MGNRCCRKSGLRPASPHQGGELDPFVPPKRRFEPVVTPSKYKVHLIAYGNENRSTDGSGSPDHPPVSTKAQEILQAIEKSCVANSAELFGSPAPKSVLKSSSSSASSSSTFSSSVSTPSTPFTDPSSSAARQRNSHKGSTKKYDSAAGDQSSKPQANETEEEEEDESVSAATTTAAAVAKKKSAMKKTPSKKR